MMFQKALTALSLVTLIAACGGSRDKALTEDQKKELFATMHSAQTLGNGTAQVNKKGAQPAENNGGGRGRGKKLMAEMILGSSLGSVANDMGMIPSALAAEEEAPPANAPQAPVAPSEAQQIGYALNEANCELVDKGDFINQAKSGNLNVNQDVSANGTQSQIKVGSVLADATISGTTCPIKANFKAVVAALSVAKDQKSGSIKINFDGGYEAVTDAFKKLTDIVKVGVQGALSMKGGESGATVGFEAASNIVSTARGEIAIGMELEAEQDDKKNGSVEATMKIALKGFTAKIVMEAKTEGEKVVSQKLTLNGEEITPEELKKRINQGA